MIKGIGVDIASISEISRLCGWGDSAALDAGALPPLSEENAFFRRTFTSRERSQALASPRPAQTLAGTFAVKEALYKAVSCASAENAIDDVRWVETLRDEHGCPHVTVDARMSAVLASVRANEVLVSITNEGDYACAFVVVQ